MLKLSEITGRPVVDMDAADKLGEIDEIVVDPEAGHVAGFIVSRGPSLLGGGQKLAFAASAVHSIGPDAVTVRGATLEHAEGAFAGLPRRRNIVGRKVVGHSGKMYGHIHDVLIDPNCGDLVGYTIDDSPLRGLEGVFGSTRDGDVQYVRADADLRVGAELVMVPDDAIVRADLRAASGGSVEGSGREGWQAGGSAGDRTSVWIDQRMQATQPVAAEGSEPAATTASPAGVEPAYEELAFGTTPASARPPEA